MNVKYEEQIAHLETKRPGLASPSKENMDTALEKRWYILFSLPGLGLWGRHCRRPLWGQHFDPAIMYTSSTGALSSPKGEMGPWGLGAKRNLSYYNGLWSSKEPST